MFADKSEVKRLFSISARVGFLALISVAHLGDALAWPPTYGLELNLESHELEQAWSKRMNANADSGQTPTQDGEHRIARGLMEKIREACKPDCSVTEIREGKFGFTEWKFRFASGFGFTMSVDPATVELQVGPWALQDWKRHGPELQKWLFDFTQARGFTYRLDGTDGHSAHLNIGLESASGSDGKLFARYLADYWQHPELGSGILGSDDYNAPLLGELSDEQRQKAKAVIESTNQKKLTPQKVAQLIEAQVYTSSPGHESGGEHYQAIGLKYATKSRALINQPTRDVPFEFRANRQPLSAEQAVLQVELKERRMEYLRSLDQKPVELDLALVIPDREESRTARRDRVTGFYLYLDEMGASGEFDRFKAILDADHQKAQPWPFVKQSMNWKDTAQVQALERFAKRARQSPAMLAILKAALLQPEASASPAARKILAQMGDLALDPSQPAIALDALNRGLSPASDPLCSACMVVAESSDWKELQEAQDLLKKFQSLKPSQMKQAPGFLSACQTFFGLRAKSP